MKIIAASHLDHGLNNEQVKYLLDKFSDRTGFFIETIELPEALGTVPCALRGPAVGDDPITEDLVRYEHRGERSYPSRVVSNRNIGIYRDLRDLLQEKRTNKVTVIAGPAEATCEKCFGSRTIFSDADGPDHGGEIRCPVCFGLGTQSYDCAVYTMYGGPLAPKEPEDLLGEFDRIENFDDTLDRAAKEEKLSRLAVEHNESVKFWSQHALVA